MAVVAVIAVRTLDSRLLQDELGGGPLCLSQLVNSPAWKTLGERALA